MDNKKLAQACLDEFGEEEQRMQMIEEMSELTTELCHFRHGRRVADKVEEEIADCYAVLDQMNFLYAFDRSYIQSDELLNPNQVFLETFQVIGRIQQEIAVEPISVKVKGYFLFFKMCLNQLTDIFDAGKIEAWKLMKRNRMIARLKARGVEI